jgi:hypothetical protein
MSNPLVPKIIRSANAPWSRASIAASIGATCLPLLAMGVTAKPAWDWKRMDQQVQALRERVALADSQSFRHDAQSSREFLAATNAVRQELLALLPTEFDRIELFSLVRQYSSEADIALQTLQLGKDAALGLGQEGLDVARLELELRGTGQLASIETLLSYLDEAGLPVDVDQLTVARRADGSYDLVLHLGLFHWTTAQPTTEQLDQP